MSIGDSAIFGMMSDKMSWLSQRQRVLSQNIANADTPDYKARDIAKLSFTDQARPARPMKHRFLKMVSCWKSR